MLVVPGEQTAVGLTAIKTSNSPLDVNGYLICSRSTCDPTTRGEGSIQRDGRQRVTHRGNDDARIGERRRRGSAKVEGGDDVHCPVVRGVKFGEE